MASGTGTGTRRRLRHRTAHWLACQHPERAAALVQAVPGLTLTLDYGHFVPRGFAAAEVDPLLQHATHFHVRGVNSQSGATSWQKTSSIGSTFSTSWIKRIQRLLELEFGGNNLTDTVEFRDYLRSLSKS